MVELAEEQQAMKRRRRPAKSCEPCRARKVRCDQRSPCGPCRKSRAAPTCVYAADTIRLPSPEPSPDDGSGVLSTAPQTPVVVVGGSNLPWQNVSETAQLQQQIKQLQTRIDSLESRVASQPNTQVATPTATIRVAPILPKLRQTADKNKLFGANHWIHTVKHINTGTIGTKDVEVCFETLPKLDFARVRQVVSKLRQTIKQFETPPLNDPVPDMLSTIPNRARCDTLVDTYMATHEKMYRILHVPTFYDEYEAFWADPSSSRISFRMELVLILAIGAVLSDEDSEPALTDRQGRTWIYAAQWWLVGPTEKSTFNLEGMQITCLLQLARQMTGAGRAWVTSGSLLQMAFSVGLHRDPSHFVSMTPFQAEMQRRLWATVRELSLLAAMDSALHVSIDSDCYDTKPPANINDIDMVPDAAADSVFTARPDDELTDSSLQRLLLQSFPDRLKAAQQLHSLKDLVYTDTIHLASKIRSSCTQLSHFFDTHRSSPLVTKFHRIFLDIHFRLHILRLHRQFLLQRPDEANCFLSRKVCLDTAMIIASYTPPQPPPQNTPNPCTSLSSDIHLRRLALLFVNTTGATKSPLALEITTILGLEIHMQLAEEPQPATYTDDAAGQRARAGREPIFAALQGIADALLLRMEQGSPRAKAFGLTTFIIAQLRALERGEKQAQALHRVTAQHMGSVQTYMEEVVERLSVSSVINGNSDATMGDFDIDALLAMDFTGTTGSGGGGMFDFNSFGMGDSLW